RPIARLDADRVPAAVLFPRRRIAEIVLLTELVGDVRGRRIQVASVADDFRAAAAVVGHVAQGDDVDAIVVGTGAAGPAAASAAAWRLAREVRRPAARGGGQRPAARERP